MLYFLNELKLFLNNKKWEKSSKMFQAFLKYKETNSERLGKLATVPFHEGTVWRQPSSMRKIKALLTTLP